MSKIRIMVQPRQGQSPTGTTPQVNILKDKMRRTIEISYTYDVAVVEVFDGDSGRFCDHVAVEATLVVNQRRAKVSDPNWYYDRHYFIRSYISESPYADLAYEAFKAHIECMIAGAGMVDSQQLELTDDHGDVETPNPTYSR